MPQLPRHRLAIHRSWLALALALAVPAYALTNESFRPIEERVHLQGRDARWSFGLASPESLFLEFEFTVRASSDGRAGIVLALNDTEVATIQAETLYIAQRARLLVPLDAVRKGENRLHVRVDGPPSATFELNLRLHNYYGISPRFPRAVVVSDEAVTHFIDQLSMSRRALRFVTLYLLSLIVVWGIARVSGRQSGAGAYVLMLSPSVLLWCTVLYGLATPLHIWLSLEALVAVGLIPWFLTATALWIPARRVVARVVGATMVMLILLEIGLRLFNSFSPSSIFYTDSYSRYRGHPGAPHLDSHLNSLGFNDVEYEPSKSPDVYRVAAIGDSVAFGVVPYRANYLTLLESELAADGPIEVINLGVPGTEPKDYLAILLEEGLAFQPDLVMVGFFIGNDFESAAKKPYEHSYVATSLYFLWQMRGAGMPAVVRTDSSAASYDDDEPGLAWDRFLEIAVDRAKIYSTDQAGLRTPMTRVVGYLRDMGDISRRAGADILVVLIPDEVQVDEELRDQVVRAHGSAARDLSPATGDFSAATGAQFDFRLPNRLLAVELAKEGIPFLDLLPVFEQEGRQTRLYKPRDTHWNLAGNRLAASTIARFLREHEHVHRVRR